MLLANRRSLLPLVALLAALGCGESRPTAGRSLGTATLPGAAADGSDVTVNLDHCVRCHGDAARGASATDAAGIQAAPPVDVLRATSGAKVGAHQAHLTAGALRGSGVPCGSCHVAPATPTAHVPGVGLRGLAETNWSGAPAIDPQYTAGNCSNTYCHGAFPGGSNATVTWTGGASEAACGSCHGLPPTYQSDGVTLHASNTSCGSCHEGYSVAGVNAELHIDGTIDGGCTGCHGTTGRTSGGIAGATYDANQDAAPPVKVATHPETNDVLVGAHLAHVNPTPSTVGGSQPTGGVYKPIACTECHPDNTTGAHPDDAQAEVTFVLADGADLSGFSPARVLGNGTSTPTTCSTYCHNDIPGGTVAWNGPPATCGSCHGFPPASHASMTSSTECATCHDGTVNLDGTIDIAGGLHIDGTVQASGCTGCHGTDARPNGDMALAYDANQNAAPPVPFHAETNNVLVGAHLAHVNPSVATGVYKPIACIECHPVNTAGGHPDFAQAEVTFALATAADLALFVPDATPGDGSTTPTTCTTYCHNGPFEDGYGGSAAAWSWNGAAADCGSCHGYPPATAGHAGLNSSSHCGGCHPGYTATTVDLATHINGQLDGGESIGGLACGDCHASIFSAMNGTVAKASKHSLGAVAGTNDSATDSGITWGSPLSGNAAASRSCVNMCHGDHPHDLTSPVVATHEYNAYLESTSSVTRGGTTREGSTRAKTDFLAGETNGGLCTSCHRNPVSSGGPTVSVGAYGSSAHDFIAASGSTWQYTLHSGAFDRNCTKCHASNAEGTTPTATANSSGTTSVHFNANPTLLAGKTNPAGTAAGFVCYNCHGSTANPANGLQGNRSGKDVQTQIAKTRNHPAVADAVHASDTEFAAGWGTGLGGVGRHANCIDCHAPHATRAGLHAPPGNDAGPALEGAWGVRLSSFPALWTAPGSGNFTKTTIVAGTDLEATLCFKCHSSWYWGTGTPPNGLSPNGSSTTPLETDVAQEFNPNNRSGHPVLAGLASYPNSPAPKALATAQLLPPWNVNVGTQTMTCSDCHGTDAAAPAVQGPHGSAAQFMLKGAYAANWPNMTLSNIATAWCSNCHVAARTGNNAHSEENHSNYQCHRCHIVVPHGGKLSRLMADNDTMPSRYAYNGTLNTSNMQAFTKAATRNGYGKGNCKAQCAGDHNTTNPTENW